MIEQKDTQIESYVSTISKLSSENSSNLESIKNQFLNQHKEMFEKLKKQKDDHVVQQEKFKKEIKLRDVVEKKLNSEKEELEGQVLKAKKILMDPELNRLANRQF